MEYPILFQNLIDCFKRLPGVGNKSAEKMAFDVLSMNKENVEMFKNAFENISNLTKCPICGNMSMNDNICEICANEERNHKLICVVSSPKDVLNGIISPSKNKGYNDINLESLINRVKDNDIEEVILATDLTMDGEITAMYITKLLNKNNVSLKVSRLAHGLPMGAQLDYADEMTLFKAYYNRKQIDK